MGFRQPRRSRRRCARADARVGRRDRGMEPAGDAPRSRRLLRDRLARLRDRAALSAGAAHGGLDERGLPRGCHRVPREARAELHRPLMAEDTTPPTLADLAADLTARRERAVAMGGVEAIAKQHGRGKLTARERIALLFDAGTFVESGLLAPPLPSPAPAPPPPPPPPPAGETPPARPPADGVVTGEGLIDGRRVYCAA